jgi:hypothetical protein
MTDTIDSLQLDRAEFTDATAATVCAMCANPLSGIYYEANGQTVCAGCSESLRTATERGTGLSRAARATGAGFVAMLGGSILYWAILAMTGIEFGLIAIVVGFAVGKAVNWGSYGRGGWKYQTLAMILTYMAIVSAYVPIIVGEMRKQATTAESTAKTDVAAAGDAKLEDTTPTPGNALVAVAVLAGLILAIPFLSGLQNIMGLIIIGIGLYEAWKFNRKRVLEITGPHVIGAPQLT